MHKFEWDEDKNAENLTKHGICFKEAAAIFEGPVFTLDDEGSHKEVRERSYGLVNGIAVICVIHTDRVPGRQARRPSGRARIDRAVARQDGGGSYANAAQRTAA
jgi:uncharacterized DUF497 family protein